MATYGFPPGSLRAERSKAPDLLPLYSDILIFWDIFVGFVLGSASVQAFFRYTSTGMAPHAMNGPLMREVLLSSIISALILREPLLAVGRELCAPRRLLVRLGWRVSWAAALLLCIGLLTRDFDDLARSWVVCWCGLFFLSACGSRAALLAHLHRLACRGAWRETVAVIGAPDVARQLAVRLAENACVVRVIEDFEDDEDFDPDAPPSGPIADLVDLARSGGVDTIVVALNAAEAQGAPPILQHLQSVPVQITICSDVEANAKTRATLRMLGTIPMSVVTDRPLKHWDLFAKTVLDKAGALLILTLAGPIMLLVALAVACDSEGPVIFRQRRSGWGGRLFTIYKFRTMHHGDGFSLHRQTERGDARFTRTGALLRRTSLDELPQLFNVLRGDMSLVGPRPHADRLHAAERAGCTIIVDYAQRQRVKPGLTGWAQIHGSRGAVRTTDALRKRVALDLYYIEHWSLWLDVKILAQTPRVLLFGEGAF